MIFRMTCFLCFIVLNFELVCYSISDDDFIPECIPYVVPTIPSFPMDSINHHVSIPAYTSVSHCSDVTRSNHTSRQCRSQSIHNQINHPITSNSAFMTSSSSIPTSLSCFSPQSHICTYGGSKCEHAAFSCTCNEILQATNDTICCTSAVPSMCPGFRIRSKLLELSLSFKKRKKIAHFDVFMAKLLTKNFKV